MNEQDNRGTTESFMAIGSYLKRKISIEGQSINDFAKSIGVHPQTIYNVTRGEDPRSISAKLALKLSKHFVEDVEFWLSEGINIPENTNIPTEISSSGNVIPMTKGLSNNKAQRDTEIRGLTGGNGSILVDRDIENLLTAPNGPVTIHPYSRDQIQPATFDLTMGLIMPANWRKIPREKWAVLQEWSFSDKENSDLNAKAQNILDLAEVAADDVIKKNHDLKRNESVFILAREHVKFGKNHLARVGAIAENVMKGLQVSHGLQVDPGFSGPFFVIFTNLCEDNIGLQTGNKLVSLELHKLAYAPDKAYKSDADAKCAEIAVKLTENLQKLFAYKDIGKKIKASSEYFDDTPVGSLDSVKGEVLDLLLGALKNPSKKLEANLKFWQAIDDAAENILIKLSDAKALGVLFDISRNSNEALSSFSNKNSEQTLKDTIERLNQDLVPAIVRLTQGDIE